MKNQSLFFRKYVISFCLLIFTINGYSQSITQGTVFTKNLKSNKNETLIGATIRWQNSLGGVITDSNGVFAIQKIINNHQLIISIIGYKTDTIMVHNDDFLKIEIFEQKSDLNEVIVKSQSSSLDLLNPIQTQIITSKELKKAACCNLSESFETNASVSVNYSDAITGAKQIQMLGLSGNYIQINTENIPNIRGLNTTFGLNYTPGTWVSSIDVGKGTGSVVNGYESMIGVINVELINPDVSDKFFINTYLNSQGRGEINVHAAHKLSKKWSTLLLTHGSALQTKLDGNNDGFLDIPKYNQINVLNKWKYQNEKMMMLFGVKVLNENRNGGQLNFNPVIDKFTSKAYGFGSVTNRSEFFTKIAFLYPNKPYQGLGLITNGLIHDNNSYFGFKKYKGNEKSFYSNLIYQNIINNTNHTYKLGTSILLDNFNESLSDSTFKRNEVVPGFFGEYTFTKPEKLVVVLGSRIDFHNMFGNKFTPRLHVKYDLTANTALRLSLGKGWRVANPLAENFGNFVNSRSIKFESKIMPEETTNYGVSLAKNYFFKERKGSLIVDFYKTSFQNQLVVDMETFKFVKFYNQIGQSYSNSFQIENNINILKNFDVKLAYRMYDVKNDVKIENEKTSLLPKQFVSRDRILLNLAYATKWEKWKIDFTWQWNGKRRVPNTEHGHVHTESSPLLYANPFSTINAQVSKKYKNLEIYLGGENLTGFTQKDPILEFKDPFGPHFDASMVWGSVTGAVIYSGLRWKIEANVD